VPAFSDWNTDFKHQPVSVRPKIEVRYTDASRKGFEIDAECYRIKADLQSKSGQTISFFAPGRTDRNHNILGSEGAYLRVIDQAGREYKSSKSMGASRINIYRRGPYYIETHWLDISLTNSTSGAIAPIKGEIIFYSYPEKTHIRVKLHVTGEIRVSEADLAIPLNLKDVRDKTLANEPNPIMASIAIVGKNPVHSFRLLYPVKDKFAGASTNAQGKNPKFITALTRIYDDGIRKNDAVVWNPGDVKSGYLEIFPLDQQKDGCTLVSEMNPMGGNSISTLSGRSMGYDSIRGCYVFRTDTKGGFTYHFNNPNDYEIAKASIRSVYAGKVYVMHDTGENPGSVECGIVLDEAGYPLPITVQISKNFAGENEEPYYNPGDTAFSETIFPLYLDPQETRSFTSLHLYQNWGRHMLKQFSSLGAWMDYYHMSTGVTETTCYVPFMFGGIAGVNIADLRPMSQRMWDSQPQHDNVAGHSFLRYQDDQKKWHYLEYVGTTFRSTGPNWADMSLEYVSDDNKAKMKVDVFELPQKDELRNFMHIRIDFKDGIKIAGGDMSRNLRIFNIATWVQQLRYKTVACGGPQGSPLIKDITLDNNFTLSGAKIPSVGGYAVIYPEQRGANAYILRDFKGRIGGKSIEPGVSILGEKSKDCTLMLVPVTKSTQIIAGDYIETDIFIMPYGGGNQDYKPAQKASVDYAINPPKVTSISKGSKINDFPTRIRLDKNGTADFTITGGMDCIPIIVEGARDYKSLRMYNGDHKLIELSRPGEKDGYQTFTDGKGSFGSVFLVTTDGKEHRYFVQ